MQNSRIQHRKKLPILSLLILLISGSLAVLATRVTAQSSNEPWATPINLSHSGGTSNPHLVIDSEDRVHVIWQNASEEWIYTRREADQWSDPAPVQLPFTLSSLRLMADQIGYIHAFWKDPNGSLLYSRSLASNIATFSTWTVPQVIAESATKMAVALNDQGGLHLAYIRSDQSPGLYYRIADSTNFIWSMPQVLYTSPYFRGLSEEDTHLSLAADAQGSVHVAWDDSIKEQVYLASATGDPSSAQAWGDPQVLDQRQETDGSQAIGPSKSIVMAFGDELLYIWQAGHEGSSCAQYYQRLDGSGNPLAVRQVITSASQGCSENYQYLGNFNGQGLLLTGSENGYELLAWDWTASHWSLPQRQSLLTSGFVHPETYRQVILTSQQMVAGKDGQLYLVGVSEGKGQDVWFSTRTINEATQWYPTPTSPSAWNPPTSISRSQAALSPPVLVAGSNGRLHVFWSQAGDNRIYYATREGGNERWSGAATILETFAGEPQALTAGLSPDGLLLLSWRAKGHGEVYLSWVAANQAGNPDAWMTPQILPLPHQNATSSQLKVNRDGMVYFAYVVPLNEGRGVYLTTSSGEFLTEAGDDPQPFENTWSSPITVFDAVNAGWDMIGKPELALKDDGSAHILLERYSFPPDEVSLGTYYTRSDDGQNWAELQAITDQPVFWSEILVSEDGTIHRAWQDEEGGRVGIWHQYSLDGGANWSEAATITRVGSQDSPVDFLSDTANGLHLFQIIPSGYSISGAGYILSQFTWDPASGGWLSGERTQLTGLASADYLSAAVLPNGELLALYGGEMMNEDGEQTEMGLFSARRLLEISAEAAQPLPTFTPEPAALSTAVLSFETTPTPTLVFAKDSETLGSFPIANRWMGLAMGGGLAVLVVGAALVFGIRGTRGRNGR
ncbi:MAG: hypothetical protein ABIG63_17865 [Chloroflexota bacterium]